MKDYLLKCTVDYWKEREWQRYTDGDYISSLTDVRPPNTLLSWLRENHHDLTIKDCEKHITSIQKVLSDMSEEEVEKLDDKWHADVQQVQTIIEEIMQILLAKWTSLTFHYCGENSNKNDYIFPNEYGSFSFWRLSTERKNKIIFLPGIQLEVAPFLQAIRVKREHREYLGKVIEVLRTYHAGYLYERVNDDEEDNTTSRDQIEIPLIQMSLADPKPVKRGKAPKARKLTENIDRLVKKSKKTKKPKQIVRTIVPSRSPSMRRDERIKYNLYTEVAPIWKKTTATETTSEPSSGHCVDFNTETFLGPVYHLVSYETGKKAKQCGAWMMRTETDLEEHKMSGEALQISLKVPVEEVFVGPSEPVIAFCEEGSNDWKKGVYTTHTQFDQNTFVVNARLSKMGCVALFQQTDFHFPYRKWSIIFNEDTIEFKLHTNSVEIKFVIEGHLIYLETQTGDEFSKLRCLHQKKMTLAEMARQLERHGVYIFPNDEALRKQRDTKKEFELELHCYRMICLEQLPCVSSRLNGSVSNDTVIMSCHGTTLQVVENPGGGFHSSYGAEPTSKTQPHSSKIGLSSLFRWILLTRPIPMTK